ncbi:hypothetical protein AMTRI_Chr09g33020 [Amborella trichopoda]
MEIFYRKQGHRFLSSMYSISPTLAFFSLLSHRLFYFLFSPIASSMDYPISLSIFSLPSFPSKNERKTQIYHCESSPQRPPLNFILHRTLTDWRLHLLLLSSSRFSPYLLQNGAFI